MVTEIYVNKGRIAGTKIYAEVGSVDELKRKYADLQAIGNTFGAAQVAKTDYVLRQVTLDLADYRKILDAWQTATDGGALEDIE